MFRRAYISLPLLFFLLIGISAHTNGKNLVSSKTDPTGTVSYGYDDSRFLETVTEGGTTISRSYDERGRLKTYTNADGDLIQYAYDANNNLTRLTYPDGKQVNYTYNARNLLATVTDWNNRITTYQYDRLGRLIGTTRPNGTANIISHDAASQLTSIKETANGKLISYLKFDYDAASQITRRFRAPLVNSGWQHPTFAATYDDDNRLASLNSQAVTHDADGNMTQAVLPSSLASQSLVSWVLSYNSRNQLTNAAGISYTYDAEGQRRTITNTSGTSRDVIDPSSSLSRLLVRHHPDNTKTYYVYGLGLLYEVDQAGKTKTHHYDQVGSTIARTDDTGKVIGKAEYSAYGICFWKQGDMATPFLYNGQAGVQTDPNGLLNMRARYYSPYLMRFLNADPIGFSGGSNWFAYADGNPISLGDPFGLCAQKCYECHPQADWGKSIADSYSLIDYTQTVGAAWDDYAPSWMQSAGREVGRLVSDVGAGALGPHPEMIFAGLGNAVRGAQTYIRAGPAANTIDSAAVRFSQSSISRNFSTGGAIDDLASGLRTGSVNPTSIPPIRLVEREGTMFTLDNRRLWSFQQAEVPVPYRMATPQEAAAEAWKFTTPNGGTSIRVRGQ